MKLLSWIERHIEELLGGLSLIIVVSAVTVNVVMRYVFESSFPAANELASMMIVWAVMFGSSAAARRKSHPSIDIASYLVPAKVSAAILMIVNLAVICLLGYLMLSSWAFAWGSGLNETMGILGLPYIYTYLALPVGFGLMLVRFAVNSFFDIRYFFKERQKLPQDQADISQIERGL